MAWYRFLLCGATLLLAAQAAAQMSADPYQELFFSQRLDHFNPTSTALWSHRYLLNNRSWDGRAKLANGCPGPILLYTGNEGPIDAFWDSNGFMIDELAPRWGALLLFPEQRFYGKSLPFGQDSFSPEHLAYLTTAQVLEDLVAVVAQIKSTHNAQNCPVIAFGGSYGGTLTALLRAAHPTTVIGGLAASSELGYYDPDRWGEHGVTEFSFEDIVVQDYSSVHPECMPSIRKVIQALDRSPAPSVVQALHACSADSLKPLQSSLYSYALEALPQMDYPYAIGAMPANPVNFACKAAMDASALHDELHDDSVLLQAAAAVTGLVFGNSTGCLGAQSVAGPGNTPGDGPGPSGPDIGAWGYQSCTETLHRFSARGFRQYAFNYDSSAKLCGDLYRGTVRPDMHKLVTQFGGYALAEGTAGVSRLIWSQGTLDPWHGWFHQMKAPRNGSQVYHFLMRGSAHHLDLKSSNPADPADVTAARAQYVEIMEGWIRDATE